MITTHIFCAKISCNLMLSKVQLILADASEASCYVQCFKKGCSSRHSAVRVWACDVRKFSWLPACVQCVNSRLANSSGSECEKPVAIHMMILDPTYRAWVSWRTGSLHMLARKLQSKVLFAHLDWKCIHWRSLVKTDFKCEICRMICHAQFSISWYQLK